MRLRHLFPLAILLTALIIYGCSGGDGLVTNNVNEKPTDGGRDFTAIAPYQGGHNLGTFQLMLDETAGTVECTQVEREGQKDVTAWAMITIEKYHFDPLERNWYIDARITNKTKYTGWGGLVVFTELGAKNIVGQDGYLFIPDPPNDPKRCPVVAYSKFTEERIFPPKHSDVRTIIIHIPPEAPGLSPIEFFIDAWWPGPRLEPYVEDLKIEPSPVPEAMHIIANIRDWQTPESSLLIVKGIIPMDSGEEPLVFDLFDDGMHGDGGPNDYLWGGDFMLNPPGGGFFMCIVKAFDPEQHSFENDIGFFWGPPPPPCEPIPHWPVDEGPHCKIPVENTWVFYDEEPFVNWWVELKGPDIPPPPIFWQYHQVFGITLGERPSSGYWIRIDDVCIDKAANTIIVKYTEMVPGESCPTLDVITTPYIVVGMMRYEGVPVEFHKNVEVYECPPCDPLPFEIIEEGAWSQIHDPVEKMIWNADHWAAFYKAHNPGVDPPKVNFEKWAVAVMMLGDRPTGGFWVRLDEVCIDKAGIHIRYTEMIPGPDCPVIQIITQPYLFAAVPRHDVPYIFEKKEEIYPCPPPDCLKFFPLDHGMHSGFHEKVRHIFNNMDNWTTFWQIHNPEAPVPEVNFEVHTVVAVVIGDRPTTGYDVHIDWICPSQDSADGWDIQYTIEIPADNCPVEDVITQPFDFVVAQKFQGPVNWIEQEHVYDCPNPDCLWFELLDQGDFSGWHEENLQVIKCPVAWQNFWDVHAPGSTAPPINWDKEMVVALAMGDYPTTGFWVHLDQICFNKEENAWIIDFTFEIPGKTCDEDQVITQPFAYYRVQRAEGDFIFNKHEHVYECDK